MEKPKWWLSRPKGLKTMSDEHLLRVLQAVRREAKRRGLEESKRLVAYSRL